MRYFMDFISVKTYDDLLQFDTKSIESHIRDFIIYLRDEKKLADSTINGYVAAADVTYPHLTHTYISVCNIYTSVN
jgi:hypothetical protein